MELQPCSPLLLILCTLESCICLCLSPVEEQRQHWGLESSEMKTGLEPISSLVGKPEGQLNGAGELPIERKSSLRNLVKPLCYGSSESLRNESLLIPCATCQLSMWLPD